MNMVRKVIESTYTDSCSVAEYQKTEDPVTKLTGYKEITVLENQPCRLSFEQMQTTGEGSAASVKQVIKLFVSPDISVKAGSKLTVTRNNVTTDYTNSGVPAVYPTHQEIILDLFERWA